MDKSDLYNFKMAVTPEESKAVQLKAFEVGVCWASGDNTLKNTDQHAIAIDGEGEMYYNPVYSYREITPAEWIALADKYLAQSKAERDYPWECVPLWTEYAATQSDGMVWLFEREPTITPTGWSFTGEADSKAWNGNGKDWKNSLRQIPEREKELNQLADNPTVTMGHVNQGRFNGYTFTVEEWKKRREFRAGAGLISVLNQPEKPDSSEPTQSASDELPGNQKYNREIKPSVFVDVYDVLSAFDVVNPALQHLVKKALAVGQRGHKDASEDYQDIIDSAIRAKQLYDAGMLKLPDSN